MFLFTFSGPVFYCGPDQCSFVKNLVMLWIFQRWERFSWFVPLHCSLLTQWMVWTNNVIQRITAHCSRASSVFGGHSSRVSTQQYYCRNLYFWPSNGYKNQTEPVRTARSRPEVMAQLDACVTFHGWDWHCCLFSGAALSCQPNCCIQTGYLGGCQDWCVFPNFGLRLKSFWIKKLFF